MSKSGRELYEEYTNNHPTIHCNRFPTWGELSHTERRKWDARVDDTEAQRLKWDEYAQPEDMTVRTKDEPLKTPALLRKNLEDIQRLYDQLDCERTARVHLETMLKNPGLVIRVGTGPYHTPGRNGVIDYRDYLVISPHPAAVHQRDKLSKLLLEITESNIESLRSDILALGFDPDA